MDCVPEEALKSTNQSLKPYQKFWKFEASHLNKSQAANLREAVNLAEANRALAYFYYLYFKWSKKSKLEAGSVFTQFVKQYKEPNDATILKYFEELKAKKDYSFKYLKKVDFYLRTTLSIILGYTEKFPDLKIPSPNNQNRAFSRVESVNIELV